MAGSGSITVRATYKGVSAEQTYQVTCLADPYAANIWKDGSVCFVWAPGDGSYLYRCTSAGAVSSASWAHVAWVGNAGTVTLYVNGVAKTNFNIGAGTSVGVANLDIYVGQAQTANGQWDGYIYELRVTAGVARYTGANFTPPTRAFPY